MKILVLINGAPGHRPFYSNVGDELARRGHEVVYAVDSHMTDFTFPEAPLKHPAAYLSDYFRLHPGRRSVPSPLEAENLWLAMFPDFDRFNSAPYAAWRKRPGYYRDLLGAMSWFFWDLFEEHRFDRVVYECVSNAFSYVAYLVANHFGATWLGFSGSRLPQRIEVATSQYHKDPRLAGTYRDLTRGVRSVPDDVRATVTEYLKKFAVTPPDYMIAANAVKANPLARYFQPQSLRRVARSLRYQLTQPEDREHAYQVADMVRVYPGYFAWEVRRSLRFRRLKRDFYRKPDFATPYYVYPMQYHPESSTSVNAAYYVDELTLIRNISMSLPVNATLYVKDHQHVAAARQPMTFYEEVRNMPNVMLIDPSVDAKWLVSRSEGVVASTSTMGYEAIVMGKPVFLFGTTFYDFHPLCTKVTSYASTFDAMRHAPTLTPSAEDTMNFVASYFLCTYPGDYDLTVQHANMSLIATVASVIETPPVAEPCAA